MPPDQVPSTSNGTSNGTGRTTVAKSFDKSLPALPVNAQRAGQSTCSGRLSRYIALPDEVNLVSFKNYLEAGGLALEKAMAKDALSLSRDIPLEILTFWSLNSEADIVVASATYFLMPLMVVLNVLHPGELRCSSEHTYTPKINEEVKRKIEDLQSTQTGLISKISKEVQHEDGDLQSINIVQPGPSKKRSVQPIIVTRPKYLRAAKQVTTPKKVKSEPKKKSDQTKALKAPDPFVRYDYCWSMGNKIVAILEYKRSGSLDAHQFGFDEQEDGSEPGGGSRGIQVKLIKDAKVYAKQICAYAASSNCPFAMLFDWQHLVLFRFKKEGLKENIMSAGPQVEMTFISHRNDEEGPAYFRKIVLGFVEEAYREARQA